MTDTYHEGQQVDLLENIIKPPIYSKKAVWAFSFFFTPIFGGILLSQNLKDIDKKKEANIVLLTSIGLTVAIITMLVVFDVNNKLITYICNALGASILSKYFFDKYFPDEVDYDKKKIWKPLIIGISICVAFILFAFWAQDQVVQ